MAYKRGSFPEWINRKWQNIRIRTVNGGKKRRKEACYISYYRRGIKVLMTFEEFKSWCNSHKSEIDALRLDGKIASIDRIDPDGHYEPSNMRILDWEENRRLRRVRRGSGRLSTRVRLSEKIIAVDINSGEEHIFNTIVDASRALKVPHSDICRALQIRAGSFNWRRD